MPMLRFERNKLSKSFLKGSSLPWHWHHSYIYAFFSLLFLRIMDVLRFLLAPCRSSAATAVAAATDLYMSICQFTPFFPGLIASTDC